MHICFRCSKPIEASICLFQKNYYHADCCRICTPNPVKPPAPVKEKTPSPPPPPPPPKVEIADPKKVRAAPGRLSFSNMTSFEASKDVNCIDCKKKIVGQRYLTYKLGEFRCEKCNSLLEDKCSMCKNPFETEECFKDDENNKLCNKCVKKYQEEKKIKEIEKQKKGAVTVSSKPPPAPQVHLPPSTPVKITNIIHCDCCTNSIKSDILEFEGGQFHPDCLVCHSCKAKLMNQKIFKEDKGLVCQKCKHTPKCDLCKKEFSNGESFYEGIDQKNYCTTCYNKLHSKVCSNCPNQITPSTSYVTFQEKNYHFDCFLCVECKKNIGSDNKEFYMDASKNKYCQTCVKKHTSSPNKGPKTTPWKAVCFIENNLPICSECQKQFEDGESFYKKNDQPYCENCFSKLNSKVCGGCPNIIKPGTSYVKLKDTDYHFECLFCSECKASIGSDGKEFYIDSSNKKFCGPCVKKNKSKTTKITAEIYYESDSVCCNECKKKFSNDESFYKDSENRPFCKACFAKLNGKPCGKCPNSIEPGTSYLKFDEVNYHFDCFLCGECKKNIGSDNKEFYMDASKKKYCQPCVKKYSNSNKNFKPTAFTVIIFISGELPTCFQCKKQFKDKESSYTGKENNQLYCEECFNKSNCKRCGVCQDFIKPGISYLCFQETYYHFDCFLCVECKKNIGSHNKEFYMDSNKRKYCEPCIKKSKNAKATKWIAVVFYEPNSVPNCNECNKKMANNEPFYLGKDEKSYCVPCFTKLNAKICNGCQKNIAPNEATLSLGERVFHKPCLKCYKCAKILGINDKIFPKDNQFSCQNCI